ncbi:ABC transporter substrate-binding protein [Paenibacillus fonticola]|uniref:ABC transporter substrate-binding protein n=1 Tax=Paenibacillus fonticola TaxID=379896 RepID=UPI00037F0916|nr:extracellular solute-binding protein [Paenibacillus fonticola]
MNSRYSGKLKKIVTFTLVASLAVGLMAGCSSPNKGTDSKEQKVLRIGMMYGSNDDSWFRQQYTDIYEFNNNVRIEIVPAVDSSEYKYRDYDAGPYVAPDYYEGMKKLMTSNNPVDIVIADTTTLKRLAEENLLKPLDPMIQEDKFDTSDIVPSVIESLKEINGDNQLYGLSPSFSSSALYYNKDMFAAAGIDPPTDGMTWDEVFEKARLLSKGEGKDLIYGFSFNRYRYSDPYWDMNNTYIPTLQLKMYDDKAELMTVNSPQWQRIWEAVSKLAMDNIIPNSLNMNMDDAYSSQSYNPINEDLFLSGRVAMLIGESYYVNEIVEANNNADRIKDFKPVSWDIVTVPVHAEKPDIGGNIWIGNTFSINSTAPNAEAAWDFIKFVNGEEFAKLRSRSNSYEMVSRKSYITPKAGQTYNIEAFYQLKPTPPASPAEEKLMRDMPGLFGITNAGRPLFQEVLENKKSITEALKEWEEKGNKMLMELKKNPKTQFNEDGTPYTME